MVRTVLQKRMEYSSNKTNTITTHTHNNYEHNVV